MEGKDPKLSATIAAMFPEPIKNILMAGSKAIIQLMVDMRSTLITVNKFLNNQILSVHVNKVTINVAQRDTQSYIQRYEDKTLSWLDICPDHISIQLSKIHRALKVFYAEIDKVRPIDVKSSNIEVILYLTCAALRVDTSIG